MLKPCVSLSSKTHYADKRYGGWYFSVGYDLLRRLFCKILQVRKPRRCNMPEGDVMMNDRRGNTRLDVESYAMGDQSSSRSSMGNDNV